MLEFVLVVCGVVLCNAALMFLSTILFFKVGFIECGDQPKWLDCWWKEKS